MTNERAECLRKKIKEVELNERNSFQGKVD